MSEALIGSGLVLVDLDDGVAHVRFNRPEAANGLNVPFLRALYDALMRVHGEPRARAVLLSGEGPHFCAGGDVHTFAAQGEAASWDIYLKGLYGVPFGLTEQAFGTMIRSH